MVQSPISASPYLLTDVYLSSPHYSLVISRPRPACVSLSPPLSPTLSHSHPHSTPKLIGHLEAHVTWFLQTATRILGKCISKRITRYTYTSLACSLSTRNQRSESSNSPPSLLRTTAKFYVPAPRHTHFAKQYTSTVRKTVIIAIIKHPVLSPAGTSAGGAVAAIVAIDPKASSLQLLLFRKTPSQN